MADIELVVKIPERIHYGIEKGITVNGSKASQILIDAVKNGIPLPKGHGRLIDASNLLTITDYDGENEKSYVLCNEIDNALTIIEADKTESEESEPQESEEK